MSLRKYMHPRNKYKEGPDFKKLAVLYPDFCKHATTDLSGKLRYNFNDEEGLRVLSKTLLKHDFELEVDIPAGNLVPALPLRLNYVLWIEDLLAHANLSENRGIHGIDIGTGAVCIYPLLCSKMFGWSMTATEINEGSVISAKNNVTKNDLDSLIKVIGVKNDTSILKKVTEGSESYDFTMCNPPFFNADESVKKQKRLPPTNASTGSDNELNVEGGETFFVSRLVEESLQLREKVKIYTTMLGHKSSCAFFRNELKKRNIDNSTWTEFCQGRTKRWGLAWTFLSKDVIDLTKAPVIRTRDDSQSIKQTKDRPSETIFPLPEQFSSLDELIERLKTWLSELKIGMKELDVSKSTFNGWTCRLTAYEDSWSHARRKRRQAQRETQSSKKLRSESPETQSKIDENLQNSKNDTTPEPETPGPEKSASKPILECNLIVGELDDDSEDNEQEDDFIKMCMFYEIGEGGKSLMETLRQYLINKIGIREYLLSQQKSTSPQRKKRHKAKKRKSVVNV